MNTKPSIKPIQMRHLSERKLIQLLEGTLPPEEQLLAEIHLETCFVCNRRKEWVSDNLDVLAGERQTSEDEEKRSLGPVVVDFPAVAEVGKAASSGSGIPVHIEGRAEPLGLVVKLIPRPNNETKLVLRGDPGIYAYDLVGGGFRGNLKLVKDDISWSNSILLEIDFTKAANLKLEVRRMSEQES